MCTFFDGPDSGLFLVTFAFIAKDAAEMTTLKERYNGGLGLGPVSPKPVPETSTSPRKSRCLLAISPTGSYSRFQRFRPMAHPATGIPVSLRNRALPALTCPLGIITGNPSDPPYNNPLRPRHSLAGRGDPVSTAGRPSWGLFHSYSPELSPGVALFSSVNNCY